MEQLFVPRSKALKILSGYGQVRVKPNTLDDLVERGMVRVHQFPGDPAPTFHSGDLEKATLEAVRPASKARTLQDAAR